MPPSRQSTPAFQSLAAWTLCLIGIVTTTSQPIQADEPQPLIVQPARVELVGPAARQQIILSSGPTPRDADLTRAAEMESLTPDVVAVDEAGLLRPVGDGEGVVLIKADGHEARVPVRVTGSAAAPAMDFERDLLPLLTKAGCNQGSCHGKQRGQNGFQLSLLGFDPEFDYDALTKEARGRRVFPADPDNSLLLRKASARVPHGGGVRLDPASDEYAALRNWIAAGTPRRQPDTPKLERISVVPAERIMRHGGQQQLIVAAHYSDGSRRDVTHLADYQSNEDAIAAVSDGGLISSGTIVGEAAVMARYMGHIAVSTVAVPLAGEVPAEVYAELPRRNFIDEHVWTKLQRLAITPSPPADDATFHRRAHLDIIGRLPTPEETRAFLADASPEKRERLIDRLLERPEFADFQANKWADLLRPNPYRVGIKATLNYDAWIRDSFRKNQPYDEFVRELITARGSTFRNGAVTLFRDRREPDEITTIVSQLFLGIRLECAKCHHHPFEVWGQDDFYSFAAYFAKIDRKGRGISPPISGSEEIVFSGDEGSVRHPLTGEIMQPRPLFGTAPEIGPGDDPREALAAWITSDENPYFAQVAVNRVWAGLMGRGLVEPVDDLRATNPPSNAPLLEALAADFREHDYDLKHLIRRITTSYVYGLSSLPTERNVVDTRNYSRHYRKRLRAETLLDAASDITGRPESFDAMPPGSRAMELWSHRIDSLFLDAFGRPDPNQDPPCERTGETTVVQALHLMNSENLYRKAASDEGTAAALAGSEKEPEEIVEELYLLIYARLPDDEERAIGREWFAREGITRREAAEDLMWALMNTPEFVFNN
ncbi:MAG: DUF1549 and DUF1553 domain-containing protein [Planctomycetaceae bacterium]